MNTLNQEGIIQPIWNNVQNFIMFNSKMTKKPILIEKLFCDCYNVTAYIAKYESCSVLIQFMIFLYEDNIEKNNDC